MEHIALTITHNHDIEQFYHDVLGMSTIKNFILDKDLARDIFGIEEDTTVFQLKNDELLLEIFLTSKQYDHGFNHICISTNNREETFKKATQHLFKCLRLKRENSDMIFISDKSGNIFEIMQSN